MNGRGKHRRGSGKDPKAEAMAKRLHEAAHAEEEKQLTAAKARAKAQFAAKQAAERMFGKGKK